MGRPGDDWKQQALADFGQWLEEWTGDPPAADAGETAECDLRDLFAEIAALRQETRLQNREQARVGRELTRAGALYETVADWAQHREEDLASFEQRVARAAEDRCLRPFFEVRDALVRGRAAAGELRRPPRLFRRRAPGIAGVVQGYELALRRFDRMLGGFRRPALADRRESLRCPHHAVGGDAPGRATRRQGGRRGVSQRFYARRPGASPGRGSRQPSRPEGVISMEPVIGIDLGTTNSEVAIISGGTPRIVREGDEAILPSCVGLDETGQVVIGHQARNQYAVAPERTVLSIKRLMGSETKVPMGAEEYRPQEISAFILKALKERASSALGRPVSKAVITVPAYFTDAQRQATREAGDLAGLEVVRIINEPTAAALSYESSSEGHRKILVYDLGGGHLRRLGGEPGSRGG